MITPKEGSEVGDQGLLELTVGGKRLSFPVNGFIGEDGGAYAWRLHQGRPRIIADFEGPSVDAFERLRVSEPFGVWDNKNPFHENADAWHAVTSGGAETITYNANNSRVELAVTTVSGEYAIRQTARYFPYIPGKSQLVVVTGKFAATTANNVQRIGYFDDLNGLFFEYASTGLSVVIRSSTSGSPVDSATAQASWNLDPMDGTGPSGVTLDPTKAQIFIIDFQWLGVGRVRFGFDIDGHVYYVHEVGHANSVEGVYMQTGTLPIRYEIRNTGTTASATTLHEICSSVTSEGGYALPGIEDSADNGVTPRAVTTKVPILAIRLKTSLGGKPNRRTVRFLGAEYFAQTNAGFFQLAHAHGVTATTATWVSKGADSGVEYSTDITAVTAADLHFFKPAFVAGGSAGKGTSGSSSSEFINRHSYISQNFDSTQSEIFLIYCTSFFGQCDASAAIDFIEFE